MQISGIKTCRAFNFRLQGSTEGQMAAYAKTHGAYAAVVPGLFFYKSDHGLVVSIVALHILGRFIGVALVSAGIVVSQHRAYGV